jgi:prepilin-type N-terminal cleavage/methylation domain-containing protein
LIRKKHRSGFTLLELTLATAIFALGAGAAVSAVLGAHYLERTNRETALALDAAQSVLEQIRGEDFREAYARFNDDPIDDTGVSPGADFAVPGLAPQLNDPDGLPGRITFPGDGFELREDSNDRELGMKRDLNLDTIIDNQDHDTDYRVLPVRVTVSWRGATGPRAVSVTAVLVDEEGED